MNLLLLFVKHPISGQVKTRLARSMGDDQALAIYRRLLRHSLAVSRKVAADSVVFYGNSVPENDLWQEAGYPRHLQQGEDLGARMANAIRWGIEQGYKKIVLIGSDCAQLRAEHVEKAFSSLNRAEVVLGPAKDGGYYLIGMQRMFEPLFLNKRWSTEKVLKSSLSDLILHEMSFSLIDTLSDVDYPEDLQGTFLESEFPNR
jgi:rSAM/selenodomain-associated transferase 1